MGRTSKPLVSASPIVVNESMISGMMNEVIAQGRIPLFGTSRSAPLGFFEANQAKKQGFAPYGIGIRCALEIRAAQAQLVQRRLSKGLLRLVNASEPQRESS